MCVKILLKVRYSVDLFFFFSGGAPWFKKWSFMRHFKEAFVFWNRFHLGFILTLRVAPGYQVRKEAPRDSELGEDQLLSSAICVWFCPGADCWFPWGADGLDFFKPALYQHHFFWVFSKTTVFPILHNLYYFSK